MNNTKVIIFLIIAVLAVVIVIQQTSSQVTRAGDKRSLFTVLLGQYQKSQRELQNNRGFLEHYRDVRKKLDSTVPIIDDSLEILPDIYKGKTLVTKDDYDEVIERLESIERRQAKAVKSLRRDLARAVPGKFTSRLKNPFLICAIGLTLNFCFGVDPVLAAIDEASPDPRIPNPADFAEEELKAFEKAREGVLDDLEDIFPTP